MSEVNERFVEIGDLDQASKRELIVETKPMSISGGMEVDVLIGGPCDSTKQGSPRNEYLIDFVCFVGVTHVARYTREAGTSRFRFDELTKCRCKRVKPVIDEKRTQERLIELLREIAQEIEDDINDDDLCQCCGC
jgi:hypothetical protein